MKRHTTMLLMAALLLLPLTANSQEMIGKNNIKLTSDRMTPEALWAMGRVGGASASPDGKKIVYQVGYYSVEQNKGHQMLFIMNADGSDKKQLTQSSKNETDAA